jgi:hypothetical protein
MIDAVLVFGVMNVLFEFILLGMVPPRTRLRVLGSVNRQNLLHVFFLLANLIVHWGTLIGTMAAIGAFICSIATVRIARLLWGYITEDEVYRRGVLAYRIDELTNEEYEDV